ncbi:hypothetical protein D5R55_18370 [Burkholderia cenocepacia]|uniref:Uncharacterized protein n=1 Tax=Burkholderia cenocepacia TaxID=95486 RepID=A0A3Q9F595_9BURK|nr:hypothetical protein D5R55_18370 [Burkholderia cenocepacia]
MLTELGIHVWETTWFVRSMTGPAVVDAARSADGCFTGGDIDTFMRDVRIVALARSPQRQSIGASGCRSTRL